MASVTFPSDFSRPEPRKRPRGISPATRLWVKTSLYAVFVLCTFVLGGEIALRVIESYLEQPTSRWFAAQASLLPGAQLSGHTVNGLGYLDDEFRATPPVGKTRVALLGGRATLAGRKGTTVADQLEQLVPQIEVDHFGLPEGNPGEYAVRLRRDVLQFQPQFVLVCLSPAEEVAATSDPPRPSDVRLVQLTKRLTGATSPTLDPQRALQALVEPVDYETYVRRRVAPAVVCRTTENESLERRWRAAQSSLEKIVRRCREQQIGVAVVLAPSEFQLSTTLADALRRRAGIEPKEFDVDLPQRRWSALVDHLQLPSLDLLPTFRAAETVLYETSSPDWNEQGRTLAAVTTARWLQDRFGGALAAKTP
jgi:hypothetical protein